MTVSKECESEILRLVQAEKWPEGTVASELGVHHDVVTRVLTQDESGHAEREPRRSKLDPYKGFILEQLETYPRLHATRLRAMSAERGFSGSAKIVQRFVKDVRPRKRRRRTSSASGYLASRVKWTGGTLGTSQSREACGHSGSS